MPIRFRCTYCNRLLGIATRKAGMDTICPHCGYEITVPVPNQDEEKTERHQEEEKTERLSLDDVDELMGNSGSATLKESAVGAPPLPQAQADNPPVEVPKPAPVVSKPTKPRTAPSPVPKRTSKTTEERPLFEGDLDEILGKTAVPEEPERSDTPATSGMDAMSLSEPPRQIVLGPGKAIALLFVVVALMALSFVAGYFLAPKG